jgi:putative ABC transport system substrate-binding protein
VLVPYGDTDAEYLALVGAFTSELHKLGWHDKTNCHIEFRWTGGAADRLQTHATELANVAPDVIVTATPPALTVLMDRTRTIPIIFLNVGDPVAAGFVQSLARPSGNITGVMNFEFSMGSKWLGLLKELIPTLTRTAVLLPPGHVTNAGYLHAIQEAAPSVGVQVVPTLVRDGDEIDQAIKKFAGAATGGGIIVLPNPVTTVHRDRIVNAVAMNRLQAIYPFRFFASAGGLASYGVHTDDQWRLAANYVDRILRGEQAGDIPVQAPTKFELVINLKTARALGITIPPSLLARADEVIE